MKVHGYGIVLERLKKHDIELVRQWRNSEKVRQFMEFRDEITPEMQEKWFASIDNLENNYCLIFVDGQPIGLINGAGIDWEAKSTASGGIFVWNDHWWGTSIPLAAALLMTDTSLVFGLEKTYAKILRNNSRAIDFNTRLGYRMMEGQEGKLNQNYLLTKAAYLEHATPLKPQLVDKMPPRIIFEADDPHHPVEQALLNKLRTPPADLSDWIDLEIQE